MDDMKLIWKFAAALAVVLALALSVRAAEPQSAPLSGGSPASSVSQSAPAMFASMPGGPITGGTNAALRASPFSAEIGADFMKKVMETSAKIEAARRQIAERQAQLYATNPEIKSIHARMVEGQQEINRILDADPELADLKLSRDILWSTMPALPRGPNAALMPRMPATR
jgi:hypothetical protein